MFNSTMVSRNYVHAIEESGLDIAQEQGDLLESIKTLFESATAYSSFKQNYLFLNQVNFIILLFKYQ